MNNLDPSAAWVYDATVSIVDGIVGFAKSTRMQPDGTFTIPTKMSGAQLTGYMVINQNNPTAVTGPLNYSQGVRGVPDYGWGDRAVGFRYAGACFRPLFAFHVHFSVKVLLLIESLSLLSVDFCPCLTALPHRTTSPHYLVAHQ